METFFDFIVSSCYHYVKLTKQAAEPH